MEALAIYHAHPVTGEYLGKGVADPDPLDSDNWLVPAHAYLNEPPPLLEGYAVVRSGESGDWVQVEDNRGQVYSTATGAPEDYQHFGPLPEGLTGQPRPSIYHHWTGSAWELDQPAQVAGERQQVLKDRDERLAVATLRMGPLQDAVSLKRATEDEQALLLAWMNYRVDLSRIEQQPGFPEDVEWPPSPDDAPAAD